MVNIGFVSPEERQEALSKTLGGRRTLFDEFIAGLPGAGAVSPFAQQVARSRFDPFSALFAAQMFGGTPAFAGPLAPLTFPTNFAAGLPTVTAPTVGQFQGALENLRQVLVPDPTIGQELRREQLFDDPAAQRNIITQAVGAHLGVSPFARRALQNVLARRFATAQAAQPNIPLISQFLQGEGNLGGGLFGFDPLGDGFATTPGFLAPT